MRVAVKPSVKEKPEAVELKRGNRRGELRREALLAAAQTVFLAHGYSGASIEDVVSRTGGSKASLYSYFGSKEGLFGEMVSEGCREFVREIAIPSAIVGTLQSTLRAFGLRFFKHYTEPKRVQLMRTVIAEATRFPDFAQQLYREGPQQVRIGLSAFFQRCHADGLLQAPNADLAAIQFIALVKGHCQFRSLFGLSPLPLSLTPTVFVNEAVRIFLDGCGRSAIAADKATKKPRSRSRT